jgi:hypothetical protein
MGVEATNLPTMDFFILSKIIKFNRGKTPTPEWTNPLRFEAGLKCGYSKI